MSRMHLQEVKCTKCGNAGKFTIWDSINVNSESKTKQEVKNLEFFKYICPNCGESFQIDYVTVYNDVKNNFMIYYVPNGNPEVVRKIENIIVPEKVGEKARIVFSKDDLLEKISIFEANLNDVLIELIKPFVISKIEESGIEKERAETLYFFSYKDGKITFSIPEMGDNYKVDYPKHLYDELAKRNKFKEIIGFTVIDKDNAATYLD